MIHTSGHGPPYRPTSCSCSTTPGTPLLLLPLLATPLLLLYLSLGRIGERDRDDDGEVDVEGKEDIDCVVCDDASVE